MLHHVFILVGISALIGQSVVKKQTGNMSRKKSITCSKSSQRTTDTVTIQLEGLSKLDHLKFFLHLKRQKDPVFHKKKKKIEEKSKHKCV